MTNENSREDSEVTPEIKRGTRTLNISMMDLSDELEWTVKKAKYAIDNLLVNFFYEFEKGKYSQFDLLTLCENLKKYSTACEVACDYVNILNTQVEKMALLLKEEW